MVDANTTPPPPPTPGEPISSSPLVRRAINILTRPKSEWAVIDAEPATIKDLYLRYAMILAAIPALAGLIGALAFGHSMLGITYRPALVPTVFGAVLSYVLSLVGVGLLGLIIDLLAPQFGGVQNRVKAFQVAIYSMTAAWVAGIFAIFPPLTLLAVLGLYGFYLLYLGLPRLMRSPEDKSMVYTIVVVVVALVVNLVVAAIGGAVIGAATLASGGVPGLADRGSVSGTVNVPGVGSVDVGKLEESAKAFERAAASAEGRGGGEQVAVVDPERLSALLPASVAGFARGEVSSSTGGVGGLNGSQAEAEYTRGDARIRLQVTDMGGAAAFGQLASAFDVRHSERSGDRYEKVEKIDGRLTTEKYDGKSRSGEYSVIVGERFLIEADGDDVDMNQLRGAVQAVGFGRLEALARQG